MAQNVTTLLDVWDQVNKTGGQILSAMDEHNRQVADAELQNMQLKMQKWQNDELLKFQNSTDYENFQQIWDEDFKAFYDDYNQSSGANYYKSKYTQKAGNEMLNSMKASMDIKVSQMVNAGQRNYQSSLMQNSLDLLSENGGSQDNYNAQAGILESMYAQNLITADQYFQGMNTYAIQNQYDMFSAEFQRIAAANPGMSDAELDAAMDAISIDFTAQVRGQDGQLTDLAIDRASIKAKAKEAQWSAIKEQRDANNKAIYQTNTNLIVAAEQGNGDLAAMKAQLRKVQSMRNLEISETDQRQREEELIRSINTLTSVNAAGSSGAKTQAQKDFNINDLSKVPMDVFVQRVFYTDSDAISGYEAVEAFKLALITEATKLNGGVEPDAATVNQITAKYLTGDQGILSVMQKDHGYSAKVYETIKNVVNSNKDWKDLPVVTEFVFDSLFEINMGEQFKGDDAAMVQFITDRVTEFYRQKVTDSWASKQNEINADYSTDARNYDKQQRLFADLGMNGAAVWSYGLDNKQVYWEGASQGSAEQMAQGQMSMLCNQFNYSFNVPYDKAAGSIVSYQLEITPGGQDLEPRYNYYVTGTGNPQLDNCFFRVMPVGKNGLRIEKRYENQTWEEAVNAAQFFDYVDYSKILSKKQQDLEAREAAGRERAQQSNAASKSGPEPYKPSFLIGGDEPAPIKNSTFGATSRNFTLGGRN